MLWCLGWGNLVDKALGTRRRLVLSKREDRCGWNIVSEKAREWIQEIKGHSSSAGQMERSLWAWERRWSPQHLVMGWCGRWGRGGVKDDFLVSSLGNKLDSGAPQWDKSTEKSRLFSCYTFFPASFLELRSRPYVQLSIGTVPKAPPQFQHIQDKTHFLQLFCSHSGVDSWGKVAPLSQPTSQKQWAILDFILSSLGNNWVLEIPPR